MSLKKNIKESYIKVKILKWYKRNARDLPWRSKNSTKLPEAYHIFVSEFMLQQTTVNSVVPKFNEFIEIWPNIDKLVKIKESSILKFWSGLGYYSRASNLLKSIKIIVKKHNSKIPEEYKHLILLPGVGDYTAKAVQGIAYNIPVIPIDTNIERIISRIYNINHSIKNSKSLISTFAKKLISKKNSSNFIQALMDYGSTICLPNIPKCHKCNIQIHCEAFLKNVSNQVPIKTIKRDSKLKRFTRAYIIRNDFNEILVRRRSAKGMLKLMMEIPNDEWVKYKKNLVRDNIILSHKMKFYKLKKNILYSFSHFDLNIEIYFTKIKNNNLKSTDGFR